MHFYGDSGAFSVVSSYCLIIELSGGYLRPVRHLWWSFIGKALSIFVKSCIMDVLQGPKYASSYGIVVVYKIACLTLRKGTPLISGEKFSSKVFNEPDTGELHFLKSVFPLLFALLLKTLESFAFLISYSKAISPWCFLSSAVLATC